MGDGVHTVKTLRSIRALFKEYNRPDGKYKYREQIAKLASIGKKSIVIDYQDLLKFDPDLAILLVDTPDAAIQELNKAAFDTLKVENPAYAEEIKDEFRVRIRGLSDRLNLRNVSSKYIDKLVSIGGMVVRTSEVMPLIRVAAFVCPLGHINYYAPNQIPF